MIKTTIAIAAAVFAAGTLYAAHHEVVKPAKISKADIAGGIFDRPDMLEVTHDDGHKTLDVTTLLSSDKKFSSGMYRSGKVRF